MTLGLLATVAGVAAGARLGGGPASGQFVVRRAYRRGPPSPAAVSYVSRRRSVGIPHGVAPGRSGIFVAQLTVTTNAKKYGPFGGSGGTPFSEDRLDSVGGFFGRSGIYLDRIGVFTPCSC